MSKSLKLFKLNKKLNEKNLFPFHTISMSVY